MTKISELKPTTDPLKSAEADHEGSKVALRLSPLATFLLESGLHPRLGVSKTRAATTLFEAAVQDWAASQGIDLEGEEFKFKYMQWLTRKPLTFDDLNEYDLDDLDFVEAVRRGDVLPFVKL